jgi:hypothetical protein
MPTEGMGNRSKDMSSQSIEEIKMGCLISVESLLNPASFIHPTTNSLVQYTPNTDNQSSSSIIPFQNVESDDSQAMIIDEPAMIIGDIAEGAMSGLQDAYSVLQGKRCIDVSEQWDSRARGTKQPLADDEGVNKAECRMVGKECHKNGGPSKSAVWEHLQRKKHTKQSLREENGKLLHFRSKILDFDQQSEVINGKTVCHFKCRKMLQMMYAYNIRNFETHISNCSGPPKSAKLSAGGMKRIQSFFQKQPQSSPTTTT